MNPRHTLRLLMVSILQPLRDAGRGRLELPPPCPLSLDAGPGESPHKHATFPSVIILQPETVFLISEKSIVDFSSSESCSDYGVANIGEPSKDGRAEGDPVGASVLVEAGHVVTVSHLTDLFRGRGLCWNCQSEALGRASESRDTGSGSDVVSLHNLQIKNSNLPTTLFTVPDLLSGF